MINLLAHSNIGVFLCLVPRSRDPYENNQGKIDLKTGIGWGFFLRSLFGVGFKSLNMSVLDKA